MDRTRKIRKVFRSKPTIGGAGVHLKRAFGFAEVSAFDRFLLLDDFHSNRPEHFEGFPVAPVGWYGPIVMNTQEELRIAFEEYRNGTFVKHGTGDIGRGATGPR
jgi:hypothetical protein